MKTKSIFVCKTVIAMVNRFLYFNFASVFLTYMYVVKDGNVSDSQKHPHQVYLFTASLNARVKMSFQNFLQKF